MYTILIVEDDELLQMLYKEIFEHAGFSVVIAGDGESALSQATMTQPDFMLLDIMLPKKDGVTVLRELRANPLTISIPVALLTALPPGAPLIIEPELMNSLVGYWVKDQYTPQDLVNMVSSYLQREGKV